MTEAYDVTQTASFLILPWDTGSFRDARPFYQDDQGMTEAYSLFPPSQRTAVGAVRAALAQAAGWSGRGGWSEDIIALLGDKSDLGPTRFSPLTLVRRRRNRGREDEWEPLLPFPASYGIAPPSAGLLDRAIVSRHFDGERCFTNEWRVDAPHGEEGAASVLCDNGNELFASTDKGRVDGMDGYVLTAAGLLGLTEGKDLYFGSIERLEASPAQLDEGRPTYFADSDQEDLWAENLRTCLLAGRGAVAIRETSVGIERDVEKRTVKAGMLYQTSLVRMLPDHGFAVTVHSDAPLPVIPHPITVPFGGEGRAATLIPQKADLTALGWPKGQDWCTTDGILALCLISPAAFDARPAVGRPLWSGGPDLIAAAGGRSTAIGGWFSGREGGGVGGALYFPSGSVFFVRGPLAGDVLPPVLGRETEACWGFGRYIGWPVGQDAV